MTTFFSQCHGDALRKPCPDFFMKPFTRGEGGKLREERNAVRQMAGSSTSKGVLGWHSLEFHLYEKIAKYYSVNVWNVYDGGLILKAGR